MKRDGIRKKACGSRMAFSLYLLSIQDEGEGGLRDEAPIMGG